MSLKKPARYTVTPEQAAAPAQAETHACPPGTPPVKVPPPGNSGGVHGCVMVPSYTIVTLSGPNAGQATVIDAHLVCYP